MCFNYQEIKDHIASTRPKPKESKKVEDPKREDEIVVGDLIYFSSKTPNGKVCTIQEGEEANDRWSFIQLKLGNNETLMALVDTGMKVSCIHIAMADSGRGLQEKVSSDPNVLVGSGGTPPLRLEVNLCCPMYVDGGFSMNSH